MISLSGSSSVALDFFDVAINSILYQRGLYPPSSFDSVEKYGLSTLMTSDDTVQNYLNSFLSQIKDWLETDCLSKLVMVILSNGVVVERWSFDIQVSLQVERDPKVIVAEIGSLLRQITAAMSFLPLLADACTFNILAYTTTGSKVPISWVDSDARLIDDPEHVQLRPFATNNHSIASTVSYKVLD